MRCSTYGGSVSLAPGLLRQAIAAVVENGSHKNEAPHGTGYGSQDLVETEINIDNMSC